jgi:hypothetical protein
MHIGSRISGSTLVALLAASAGSGALLALTGPSSPTTPTPVVEVHVCEHATAGDGEVEGLRREVEALRHGLESAQARRRAAADLPAGPLAPVGEARSSSS